MDQIKMDKVDGEIFKVTKVVPVKYKKQTFTFKFRATIFRKAGLLFKDNIEEVKEFTVKQFNTVNFTNGDNYNIIFKDKLKLLSKNL